MALTKEKFVKYIEFIKTQCLNQDKFIDALELLSPHTYCDAFIYSSYENILLELIEDLLDDDEDDIGYFLYETGYLNKDLKILKIYREMIMVISYMIHLKHFMIILSQKREKKNRKKENGWE